MPITFAVCVTVAASSARVRAMPKSITLTAPVWVIITLAGLMSRWIRPLRWLKSRAPQTSAAISIARRTGSRPSALMMSRSVRPSTYSMTMNGATAPSAAMSSPVSYTETIEGWLRPAADCASRRKRFRNDGSRARSARSTLIATSRPRRMSRPRWTSAMPP